MKGDSMKSYEVYEATLTFNDENEKVNICDTKNSYSDPELIFFFVIAQKSKEQKETLSCLLSTQCEQYYFRLCLESSNKQKKDSASTMITRR